MSRSSPGRAGIQGEAIPVLIGELAERAGTSSRALRYYELQGLLASARSGNGYRTYDSASVLRVRQIRGLLDAGFSTTTIRQILPCAQGERPEIELCPSVVAAMRDTLDRIDVKLTSLGGQRDAVSQLLRQSS